MISVEFEKYDSLEQGICRIGKLCEPHLVLWYIGCKGLKRSTVDFYRESIILPLKFKNPQIIFWLFDLTAWNAFKDINASIYSSSNLCDVIQLFKDKSIRCLKASRIFEKMCKIQDEHEIAGWVSALSRNFLEKNSAKFPPMNFSIGDIFPSTRSIVTEYSDWDVARAYSTFQYIEAHLIIQEILSNINMLANSSSLEITFFLPNDELKYYQDLQHSFQEDLYSFLTKKDKTISFDLKVRFHSFPFGITQNDRPYNGRGGEVRKHTLTYESVVGIEELQVSYV